MCCMLQTAAAALHNMASGEQQAPSGEEKESEKEWNAGLYDCHRDCKTFLLAVFCPCHMLGRNAQAIGEHYWTWCLSDAVVRVCLADVNCVLHAFIRQKIRAEKGIEGSALSDCATALFCYPCALVQESQELAAGPPSENMSRS